MHISQLLFINMQLLKVQVLTVMKIVNIGLKKSCKLKPWLYGKKREEVKLRSEQVIYWQITNYFSPSGQLSQKGTSSLQYFVSSTK